MSNTNVQVSFLTLYFLKIRVYYVGGHNDAHLYFKTFEDMEEYKKENSKIKILIEDQFLGFLNEGKYFTLTEVSEAVCEEDTKNCLNSDDRFYRMKEVKVESSSES